MISEKNVEWFNNSVMEESIEVSGLPDVGLVIDIDVVYDLMTQLEEAESTPQVVQLEDTPQQPKTPTTINPKASLHSDITKELNTIYIAKNADYGDAFGETYKKLGIVSAVTRITDKVNRLQSLATKSDEERLVKDESIIDTLKDLSNYALMTLIEMGYEPEVYSQSPIVKVNSDDIGIELNDALTAFANIGSDW